MPTVSKTRAVSRGEIAVARDPRDQGVTRRVSSEVARRAFSIRAIGEVIGELRRVTWPTREETFRLSVMVVAVAVAMGIFLGLVDLVFARVVGIILGN
ncbi:MAG: preprotein translocase subunit SecE [Dehalococcoidia bacterium]|nr:preprotein translocase subunit SecE [Dehalococcoidia bacterium]